MMFNAIRSLASTVIAHATGTHPAAIDAAARQASAAFHARRGARIAGDASAFMAHAQREIRSEAIANVDMHAHATRAGLRYVACTHVLSRCHYGAPTQR